MRVWLRLAARTVLDRSGWAVLLTGVGAALVAAAGHRSAGLGAGLLPMRLYLPAVWTLGGLSLILFSGVAARPLRNGEAGISLVRPLSRVGFFLAHWIAPLVRVAAAAGVFWLAARWSAGADAAAVPAGWIAAGLLVGAVLGGPIFLLSTRLESGDGLAVLALILVPALLEGVGLDEATGLAGVGLDLVMLTVPPLPAATEAALLMMGGRWPPPELLGGPAAYVLVTLGVGSVLVSRREG